MKHLLLLLSCSIALAGTGRSDVLLPGHRPVTHELVLTMDPEAREFDGGRFVAFPTRGFGVAHPVVFGEPFRFSTKYGTQVYRLQPGEPWPADDQLDDAFRDAHAHGIPCAEINSTPVANPLARVVSHYRIAGEGGAALRFALVAEQHLDARGNPVGVGALWPWLLLIAAVGAVGLFALSRRSSAAAGRSESSGAAA